jgi:ferredoxin
MKITYDRTLCQGHNRCYSLAPELFDVDDEGYSILILAGPTDAQVTVDVPTEHEDRARLAADNCPEYAITISE